MTQRTCGGCRACSLTSIPVETDYFWLPRHLVVEVTNQCNLDCIMCERKLVQPNDLMSRKVFQSVMTNLADGFQAIELSGLGEPTLAPMFIEMAKTIQDKGKILYFPTNGAGINNELTKSLKNSDDTRVNFSMDAATAETYGKIRKTPTGKTAKFDSLITSAKMFRDSLPSARMIASFTAGAYNIDEFPAFVELAKEIGFNEVFFKPVRCWALRPEKVSLRYFKDRTEKALHSAYVKADGAIKMSVERPYYADQFENHGEHDGFINYLDILPLDVFECGTGGSGSDTGTTYTTLTTPDTITGEGFLERVIDTENFGVLDSTFFMTGQISDAKPVRYSDNVALVTTTGDVCTCAARHVIGHVESLTFKTLVANKEYQTHLAARSLGKAGKSKWCNSCEKMM